MKYYAEVFVYYEEKGFTRVKLAGDVSSLGKQWIGRSGPSAAPRRTPRPYLLRYISANLSGRRWAEEVSYVDTNCNILDTTFTLFNRRDLWGNTT